MSVSRYSPWGQHQHRAARLAAAADTADSWRCAPEPTRCGTLDVPLSVWAEASLGTLTAGLVRELTEPNAAVAICGVRDGWQASLTGRKVAVFGDHAITTEAQRMAVNLTAIRFVTAHNLSNQLAACPDVFGLIVAGLSTSRGEGFWTAARRALAPGGYLAIITGSSNPKTHATIARRATTAGFKYTHHIIATTPQALSRAVDSETVSTAPGVKLRHIRAHRDVFVYQRPEAVR